MARAPRGAPAWHGRTATPGATPQAPALARRASPAPSASSPPSRSPASSSPASATRPVYQPRYRGRPDDVVAQAELLYRRPAAGRRITARRAARVSPASRAASAPDHRRGHRGPGGGRLGLSTARTGTDCMPMDDYLSGHLWPRSTAPPGPRSAGRRRGRFAQARRSSSRPSPRRLRRHRGRLPPRQGWVPLDLVQELARRDPQQPLRRPVELVREDGPRAGPRRRLRLHRQELGALDAEARWCVGWINHDKTVFRPKKRRTRTSTRSG